MLAACCRCCGLLIVLIAVILGVFNIKPVNDALVVYSQKEMDRGTAMNVLQTVQFLAGVVLPCASGWQAGMIACARTSTADKIFVPAHGWKGMGIKAIADPGSPGMWFYSHAVVTELVNDKNLERYPDFFIASYTRDWVEKGAVPEGFFPLVINLATSDPEHAKRRNFMSDFFGTLNKPASLKLAESSASKDSIMELVASAILKSLFDFYPDDATLKDISYWVATGKMLAVGKGPPGCGPKLWAAFGNIYKKVENSEVGKQFLSQAAKRGFEDPQGRLRELLFISLFAGVGGTTDTAEAVDHVVNKDAKMFPLFLKDPTAFTKEAARVFPAVAGMGIRYHKDLSVTLGNGRKYMLKKGDFVYNWNAGANVDPTVFGGSEKSASYAKEFDPQRENLDRMMTWNGEIGNILRCNTSAGCAGTAARPCPGARLSIHIVETVSKFIFESNGKGAKSEL